eukprot:121340_1
MGRSLLKKKKGASSGWSLKKTKTTTLSPAEGKRSEMMAKLSAMTAMRAAKAAMDAQKSVASSSSEEAEEETVVFHLTHETVVSSKTTQKPESEESGGQSEESVEEEETDTTTIGLKNAFSRSKKNDIQGKGFGRGNSRVSSNSSETCDDDCVCVCDQSDAQTIFGEQFADYGPVNHSVSGRNNYDPVMTMSTVIAILLFVNVVCFMIQCWKQRGRRVNRRKVLVNNRCIETDVCDDDVGF